MLHFSLSCRLAVEPELIDRSFGIGTESMIMSDFHVLLSAPVKDPRAMDKSSDSPVLPARVKYLWAVEHQRKINKGRVRDYLGKINN